MNPKLETKPGRSPLRALLPVAAAVACLAAACPVTRGSVDDVPSDARTARVAVGQSATLYDGAVRVTFAEMERGGSFANVTLVVTAEGRTETATVTATRQNDYSNRVRIPPWALAVSGFPGVDSVEVVVWRSAGPE